MTADHDPARLWRLVARRAADRGEEAGAADACAAAVEGINVSGAGLTVMTRVETARVVHFTDSISERVEELQLTCGEGPCIDAFSDGGLVLTSDLRAPHVMRRWPAFAPAASQAGASAIYAFPLQIGVTRIGVLDLYQREPRSLTSHEVKDALILADAAALLLIGAEAGETQPWADRPGSPLSRAGGYRAEVDQASGMLSVQLGVNIEEAFVRLRAYAFVQNRRLAEVARDVVARRLRFTPDAGPAFAPDPAGDRQPTSADGSSRDSGLKPDHAPERDPRHEPRSGPERESDKDQSDE